MGRGLRLGSGCLQVSRRQGIAYGAFCNIPLNPRKHRKRPRTICALVSGPRPLGVNGGGEGLALG